MATQSRAEAGDQLFAGSGEMAARMRALDWSKTPLGPVHGWPQSLKTSLRICLSSRFAIRVCWGPELVMLYNDAYIPVAGEKHPHALGSRARDIWPEIWDTIGPMLEGVVERGEACWADELLLPMERHGYAEECYFTFSYGPIPDDCGGIGGVFTPVLETTEKVIGERRLRTLRQLGEASARESENLIQACAAVVKVLSDNRYDLPFAAIYLFEGEPGGDRARATLAAATGSFLPRAIDFDEECWSSCRKVTIGEFCTLDTARIADFPLPKAPWGTPPVQAVTVPLTQPEAGCSVGFLLAGVNVRKRLDVAYRDFYSHVATELARVIREAKAFERQRALRREAEAERAKLQELFMHAPAAIATLTGPEHRYSMANAAYVRLVGRDSADDLLGKPVIQALPELSGQGIIEILDQVYLTGIPFVGNELPVKLDRAGSCEAKPVFFNFVYQAVRDAGSRIDGIFVLAIEVTEQVLARREVETREQQFRVLANSIPQMAWMADADGYITWFNDRWYEYTGTTLKEMQGWGWEAVQHPDYLPRVRSRWKHALQTGEPFDMAFPVRAAGGTFRSFLTRALPVRDSSGTIVRWFGSNTDVEMQERAETALRQSEKLAAVGRLASSIAHEINNPLEGVTNLIYLALLTSVNEETRRYLETAEVEMGRVSQIVNQTLRFHKQQSSVMPTDMAELIDSILALYRGKLARDGIELKMETSACPPLVCYAGEVRQLLANLVGNALDAMPRGGTLRLRLRPGTDWRSGRAGIRFSVADTGHGMTTEIRKHIYEPFFTTKGETGTGLGLWVSKGIVEKHGGSMHVRSRADWEPRWTIFSVTLPFAG